MIPTSLCCVLDIQHKKMPAGSPMNHIRPKFALSAVVRIQSIANILPDFQIPQLHSYKAFVSNSRSFLIHLVSRRTWKRQNSYRDPASCFKVPWSSWPSLWLFPGLPGTPSWEAVLPRPRGSLGGTQPRNPFGSFLDVSEFLDLYDSFLVF